jgi:excisionase family DNA binding protein
MNETYTVKDVAKQFSVGPAVIYRLVKEKKIGFLRFGEKGTIRISKSAIDAYVSGNTVGGNAPSEDLPDVNVTSP